MASPAETPFNSLLYADSDFNLPDNDADVIAALSAYGATFKRQSPKRQWRNASTPSLDFVVARSCQRHVGGSLSLVFSRKRSAPRNLRRYLSCSVGSQIYSHGFSAFQPLHSCVPALRTVHSLRVFSRPVPRSLNRFSSLLWKEAIGSSEFEAIFVLLRGFSNL
jgi:hypothetical protein